MCVHWGSKGFALPTRGRYRLLCRPCGGYVRYFQRVPSGRRNGHYAASSAYRWLCHVHVGQGIFTLFRPLQYLQGQAFVVASVSNRLVWYDRFPRVNYQGQGVSCRATNVLPTLVYAYGGSIKWGVDVGVVRAGDFRCTCREVFRPMGFYSTPRRHIPSFCYRYRGFLNIIRYPSP